MKTEKVLKMEENKITNVKPPPFKIFIGTPCYGGMITTDYFKSTLWD